MAHRRLRAHRLTRHVGKYAQGQRNERWCEISVIACPDAREKHESRRAPYNTPLLLTIATTLFDVGLEGVHRWLVFGPIRLHAAASPGDHASRSPSRRWRIWTIRALHQRLIPLLRCTGPQLGRNEPPRLGDELSHLFRRITSRRIANRRATSPVASKNPYSGARWRSSPC